MAPRLTRSAPQFRLVGFGSRSRVLRFETLTLSMRKALLRVCRRIPCVVRFEMGEFRLMKSEAMVGGVAEADSRLMICTVV